MANLSSFSNKLWETEAQGRVHPVVTVFVTNAVLAEFKKIEQRLQEISDSLDPHDLRHQIQHLGGRSSLDESKADTLSTAFRQAESLLQPGHMLSQMKSNGPTEHTSGSALPIRHSSQVIVRKGLDSTQADQKCLDVIFQNIAQQVCAVRRPTSIVRLGTPLYADVGYFLTHTDSSAN